MDKTNENLSTILKSFNKLDNYIAKYIYKKYIENVAKIGDIEPVDSADSYDSADSADLKPSQFKYSKKPINQEEYTKYIHTIFSIERPSIITQKESLEKELENIAIADEAYDKDPKHFKARQFDSLPYIKRCSYIRKHKNKYKRCNINVMNDDTDICYKHIDSPNMYWDRYCEVLEEIEKIEKTEKILVV